MTKRDEGKTTLVDFLRSIKFSNVQTQDRTGPNAKRFAGFSPRDRQSDRPAEDGQHIRSAN
jgi:hypothetical protein